MHSWRSDPADKIDGMNRQLLPLDLDALRHALLAPAGGYARVELLAETGSTNADMVANAASAQWPELSVLVAENQSSGRGRLDREWSTPPGSSIIASVLLRPGSPAGRNAAGQAGNPAEQDAIALPQESYSWISLLAAMALADALESAAGLGAELKWPNDVLAGGRKVAGILAQLVPAALGGASGSPSGTGPANPARPAVVVGTGVNVGQSHAELPVPTATSLAEEGAATLDRNVLLPAYLNRFARLYQGFRAAGGDAQRPLENGLSLLQLVSARMVTLGSDVRAELPGGITLQGQAVGLDAHGALLVADSAGTTHVVSAGDVVHLRRHEAQGPGAYA
jgi:BirA family biotin operon repressor/biotin-[acetyl-CoA-carboxylase] ligase